MSDILRGNNLNTIFGPGVSGPDYRGFFPIYKESGKWYLSRKIGKGTIISRLPFGTGVQDKAKEEVARLNKSIAFWLVPHGESNVLIALKGEVPDAYMENFHVCFSRSEALYLAGRSSNFRPEWELSRSVFGKRRISQEEKFILEFAKKENWAAFHFFAANPSKLIKDKHGFSFEYQNSFLFFEGWSNLDAEERQVFSKEEVIEFGQALALKESEEAA